MKRTFEQHKPRLTGVLAIPIVLALLLDAQSITHRAAASPPPLAGTCPVSSTPLTPTSHTAFPDGREFTYKVDGVEQDQTIAPGNFNPLTATATELAQYNVPPRPSLQANYPAWASKGSAMRFNGIPYVMCQPEHRIGDISVGDSAQPTGTSAAHRYSSNWSGIVVPQGAAPEGNVPYAYVEGQWDQNSYGNCGSGCSNSSTDESTWAGIGGWNSGALIQAGTDMNGVSQPFAGYEYLEPCPTDPTQECGPSEISGAYVPTGVRIVTIVYRVGTSTHFTVTAGGTVVLSVTVDLPSSYYDGSDAEWINERPTYSLGNNPYYKPLTNYGVTYWTQNCAASSAAAGTPCYAPAYLSPASVHMSTDGIYDNGDCSISTLLSYSANLNGASFQDVWCRAS